MADDLDFESLFGAEPDNKEETPKEPVVKKDDLFSFDDFSEQPPKKEEYKEPPAPARDDMDDFAPSHDTDSDSAKKRTWSDFEPNMDALLITAQSSMIIEGIKCLSDKDYSSKRLQIYSEGIKGVDLYIKILERNPHSYQNLSEILKSDIECREVERTVFNLYNKRYGEQPATALEKLSAFQLFRESLRKGYKKALISNSMINIKQYFLLSGGLNEEMIQQLVRNNNAEFKTEIARLNQHVQLAIEILKSKHPDIARGMRGKDVNIYIIKSTQLLQYYYRMIHNTEAENYYRRINETYNKYFIIRD